MKPNWRKIREEWETTKITFKALAEKHDVKEGTLKSRRSREKWSRDATNKKDATISKKMQSKKEKTEPVIESDNLTEKQRFFCIYYIKYFNATKAYQKAYKCDYESAMRSGHRLLKNVEIKKEIERMKKEQTSDLMLDVRDVLQKYIDIAFADITDFVTFGKKDIEVVNDFGDVEEKEVNYVDFEESSHVDGTIVTEVKQGRDGISVKLADKMKALNMLAKYTDLLSDNQQKRLQEEKIKAETEFTEHRTKQLKGTVKDTSMLDALVEGRKQYEQMKEREKNE